MNQFELHSIGSENFPVLVRKISSSVHPSKGKSKKTVSRISNPGGLLTFDHFFSHFWDRSWTSVLDQKLIVPPPRKIFCRAISEKRAFLAKLLCNFSSEYFPISVCSKVLENPPNSSSVIFKGCLGGSKGRRRVLKSPQKWFFEKYFFLGCYHARGFGNK